MTTPAVKNNIMNASHSIMKRFINVSVAFVFCINCDFSHRINHTFCPFCVVYSEEIAFNTTCVECFAATGKNSSKLIFDSLPAISDNARMTTKGVAN